MARKRRFCPGGIAYHVMNRTWGRIELFDDAKDYEAFERVLVEAVERDRAMRLCAWCLMPNHFHLVLWPARDGQLSRFMQWLTMTHTQRWHAHRRSTGRGHLYQSRFKSFAIQADWHFLSVCRYVERNPLRANLVKNAEAWQWSSLHARGMHDDDDDADKGLRGVLSDWPVEIPRNWTRQVNQPQDEQELAALRRARERDQPYGDERWTKRTAKRLGVESALRPRGRPRKKPVRPK